MSKLLCQIDQAGAEALIVAYECRPGALRDLFLCGIKPHVYVALRLFIGFWCKTYPYAAQIATTKVTEITKHPGWKDLEKAIKSNDEKYFLGKKTCHASNYDMKGRTFADSIVLETEGAMVLSPSEADSFQDLYHRILPEIREWHQTTQQKLRSQKRYLFNLFGYPRKFHGFWDDSLFRKAYAFVPQSTVGTITNLAFVEIQNRVEAGDFPTLDLLQNGHDSILFQADEDKILGYVPELRKHLERDLVSSNGVKYKMKTEVGIGRNWKPWDAEENPEGLKEVK